RRGRRQTHPEIQADQRGCLEVREQAGACAPSLRFGTPGKMAHCRNPHEPVAGFQDRLRLHRGRRLRPREPSRVTFVGGPVMKKMLAWRSAALIAIGGLSLGGLGFATSAMADDKVVTIGVLTDMSSLYADIGGPNAVVAVKMAVEDSGLLAKGWKIEV